MARDTFHYHKVDETVATHMADVRKIFIDTAEILEVTLPEGRPKSLCLTHLEDASMRAIQAIALEHGTKV